MARSGHSETETTDTVTAEAPEVTEVTVDQSGTPEATATSEAEAPKVTSQDLETVFNTAVATGIEAAGDSPAIPDGPLNDIKAAYRALRAQSRTKVSQALGAQLFEAFQNGNMQTAQLVGELNKALQEITTAKATPKATEPVNPSESVANQYAALVSAGAFILENLPEGVTRESFDDFYAKITVDTANITRVSDMPNDTDEQKEALKVALGELNPVEAAVLRLVTGKAAGKVRKASSNGGTRNYVGGPRRDIGKIVSEFLSDHTGEWFTPQAIVKGVEPTEGTVSSGAVSNSFARLGDGFETQEGPRKARYVG